MRWTLNGSQTFKGPFHHCTSGSVRALLTVICLLGMVGDIFSSGTDTSGPHGGTLALVKLDKEWEETQSPNLLNSVTSLRQDSGCTYVMPCRSSVDGSVSLMTTALVTCMSGCCCLASCIAIARACKDRQMFKTPKQKIFSFISVYMKLIGNNRNWIYTFSMTLCLRKHKLTIYKLPIYVKHWHI